MSPSGRAGMGSPGPLGRLGAPSMPSRARSKGGKLGSLHWNKKQQSLVLPSVGWKGCE